VTTDCFVSTQAGGDDDDASSLLVLVVVVVVVVLEDSSIECFLESVVVFSGRFGMIADLVATHSWFVMAIHCPIPPDIARFG